MGMRTDSEVASDVAQLNIVWLLRAYRREFSVFVDGKWLQYYSQCKNSKHHRYSVSEPTELILTIHNMQVMKEF